MPATDTELAMRLAAFSSSLATRSGRRRSRRGSATTAAGGSLSVEGGRGLVQITGKGVLVGRMEKGSLEILDLSAGDQWSPRVYGIPRGKTVTLRGKNVSFYVPGGKYKLAAHGTGISISARGTGTVIARRRSRSVGDTGMYAIGDDHADSVAARDDEDVVRAD